MKCAGHVGCTMRLRWTRRSDTQKRRISLSWDHLMEDSSFTTTQNNDPGTGLGARSDILKISADHDLAGIGIYYCTTP